MTDRYRQMVDAIRSYGWAPPGQEALAVEMIGRALLGDDVALCAVGDLLREHGDDGAAERMQRCVLASRERFRRFPIEERRALADHFPGARRPRPNKRDRERQTDPR